VELVCARVRACVAWKWLRACERRGGVLRGTGCVRGTGVRGGGCGVWGVSELLLMLIHNSTAKGRAAKRRAPLSCV
jgi:hypothetical protein